MKTTLQLLSVMFITLFSACSTIHMGTTAFYNDDFKIEGTIFVAHADHEADQSLEFQHYRPKIEKYLQEAGYKTTRDAEKADYVAAFTHGIDGGSTKVETRPVYGFNSGFGYGVNPYYGPYHMPYYSSTQVVGTTTTSVTTFRRAIAMDIITAQSIREGKPKKVYEMRALSIGKCSQIAPIVDEMLAGIFGSFPGVSGKTQEFEVESNSDCSQ